MSARLDQELTTRELARSRTVAARWIAEGRVLVNGEPATKASVRVGADDRLEIRPADGPDYVSRAGHKLAGALTAFPDITVAGKRCLDAGASTGGFTDVLLRAGAREVVAVDVGHDQLVPALRQDDRVRVFEGTNVRWMRPEDIGGPAQLTVCDLSFISLTLVVGPLAAATVPGGDLVLMVKPQFEVGADRLARTGVVTSEQERARAVDAVAAAARAHGLTVRGQERSPLPGQDGNHEFFLWCRRDVESATP
ncbi:TlyA family RNA methyltransferase [Kocuria turfanensis]|uniref:TlyA family rRNA (Cytidine-2'-O)-methyltransferase n=1 Tax=Kocuria turfanensis TaxID=388357 RepID=A0A512IEB3_9MICC|nr:TlyA family RNA methyltransferase [Kocuria turfanensis]GEO96035.1 TlyA family rRNA (cytidine-2'-O)-methyltransferase [Kocuria turfanensis]